MNEDIRMRNIVNECAFLSLGQMKALDAEICNEINSLTNIHRLCCMIRMGCAHAEPACWNNHYHEHANIQKWIDCARNRQRDTVKYPDANEDMHHSTMPIIPLSSTCIMKM